jgi:hypothetical protein
LRISNDLPAHSERYVNGRFEKNVAQSSGPFRIIPLLAIDIDHDVALYEPGKYALVRVGQTLYVDNVIVTKDRMTASKKAMHKLSKQLVLDRGQKNSANTLVNRGMILKQMAPTIDRELVPPLDKSFAYIKGNLLCARVPMWYPSCTDESNMHNLNTQSHYSAMLKTFP